MTYTAHDLVDWLGYMTHAEVDYLAELIRSLPADPVVINIGAGAGTSGLAIYQSRPDVILMTVDVNENSPFGCLRGERAAFRKAEIEDLSRHHQVLADSGEAARMWANGELEIGGAVDMVFIDDGHHAPDVERDITSWLPLISDGGIIALHDYGAEVWPDVKIVTDRHLSNLQRIGITDTVVAFRVKHGE